MNLCFNFCCSSATLLCSTVVLVSLSFSANSFLADRLFYGYVMWKKISLTMRDRPTVTGECSRIQLACWADPPPLTRPSRAPGWGELDCCGKTNQYIVLRGFSAQKFTFIFDKFPPFFSRMKIEVTVPRTISFCLTSFISGPTPWAKKHSHKRFVIPLSNID